MSSPALGVVSVTVAVLLSLVAAVALVLLAGGLGRLRRLGRAAAVAVLALVLVATVGVREGGRAVPRNLERFLVATGTTAFLALKGDTLLCEAYFNGGGHDATVSSFSIAKPVVSALVGIAIAEGRIGSVDDPITRYLPELPARAGRPRPPLRPHHPAPSPHHVLGPA